MCVDVTSKKVIYVSGNKESINIPTTLGSTIKPFIAIAAMNSGFDPEKKVHCLASTVSTLARERCWLVGGHGNIDLKNAIANSCSVYFRTLIRRLGWKTIRKTFLDFVLMKDQDYAESQKLTTEDISGSTDAIKICPGRIFGAYCGAFANTELLEFRYEDGKIIVRIVGSVPIIRNRKIIIEGLRNAALEGTYHSVQNKYPGLKLFGKTGTAPIAGNPGQWHGIFIGFEPYPVPQRAILVVTKNGTGAKDAAPLAFEVLNKISKNNNRVGTAK